MDTGDIIAGTWNDPHMLAGFMATFCVATIPTTMGGSTFTYEAKRAADAWTRYATTSDVGGKPNSGLRTVTLLGNTQDETAKAIVEVQTKIDELHERFRAYDRDGRLAMHTVCRLPVRVTRGMLASSWGNPGVWFSENFLWLARTWVYADIVAPWRGITEEAIKHPRKFCKPLPSPVPDDVRAAIEACLLAGEPTAARTYYQSWRDSLALTKENRP